MATVHTYLQSLQTPVGSKEKQKSKGKHQNVLQASFHRAARKLQAPGDLQSPKGNQSGPRKSSQYLEVTRSVLESELDVYQSLRLLSRNELDSH